VVSKGDGVGCSAGILKAVCNQLNSGLCRLCGILTREPAPAGGGLRARADAGGGGALEPLAPPPVQGLWEGLAGSAQPIDLGAPLSALVRPRGRSGTLTPRCPACPSTLSHEGLGDSGIGRVPARKRAGQLPQTRVVAAVLATCFAPGGLPFRQS